MIQCHYWPCLLLRFFFLLLACRGGHRFLRWLCKCLAVHTTSEIKKCWSTLFESLGILLKQASQHNPQTVESLVGALKIVNLLSFQLQRFSRPLYFDSNSNQHNKHFRNSTSFPATLRSHGDCWQPTASHRLGHSGHRCIEIVNSLLENMLQCHYWPCLLLRFFFLLLACRGGHRFLRWLCKCLAVHTTSEIKKCWSTLFESLGILLKQTSQHNPQTVESLVGALKIVNLLSFQLQRFSRPLYFDSNSNQHNKHFRNSTPFPATLRSHGDCWQPTASHRLGHSGHRCIEIVNSLLENMLQCHYWPCLLLRFFFLLLACRGGHGFLPKNWQDSENV